MALWSDGIAVMRDVSAMTASPSPTAIAAGLLLACTCCPSSPSCRAGPSGVITLCPHARSSRFIPTKSRRCCRIAFPSCAVLHRCCLAQLRGPRGDVRLIASASDRIAMHAGTKPTAHMIAAGPLDESGRGLRVVSRLAREWGASATGHRKTVWFEQAVTGSR